LAGGGGIRRSTRSRILLAQDIAAAPGTPIDYLKIGDAVEAIKNLKFVAISVTAKVDIQFFQRA